jgi:hypothetical protein
MIAFSVMLWWRLSAQYSIHAIDADGRWGVESRSYCWQPAGSRELYLIDAMLARFTTIGLLGLLKWFAQSAWQYQMLRPTL